MTMTVSDYHHASYQRSIDNHDHQHPPPPIPPSPTLTDPDMILPCDGGERESSTPSPPFKLPSLSNLQAFYGMRPPTEPDQATPANGPSTSSSRLKNNFPRHTWLHEGHDTASRRLSAIGEEEPSPRLAEFPMPKGHRLEESIIHEQMEETTAGAWSSSSSTISGASDRDGARGYAASREVSQVDQANLHGAGAPEMTSEEKPRQNNSEKNMTPVTEGGPGEEFSSAILSSEAERILDNAKKRLTLMEGNLSKARSSVRLTPSPSPSLSPSLGPQPLGLGQPVGGLYRSISRSDRKASAALRPRPTYSSQDQSSNRHSRVHSDLNLTSAIQPLSPPESRFSRSMSAMGSTSNFHNDERTFHYEPTRAYLTHRASVSSMQPVEEKPPAEEDNTTQGLGISDESKISSVEEFNSVYPQSGPPSRTQSQLQVRDLQDQMKGLHIKISTLKVKAQEDGLRRRSLQSLRIPSPLASSKNWYENEIAYKGVRNMNKVDEPLVDGSETPTLEEAVGETQLAADPKNADVASVVTDIDDDRSVVESLYEDAEEGQYAERETDEPLNETLEAFPSVPNSHGATPHEDREDAFDYEHFILHSALGNYAQTMRRSSVGSTGSVETTRPVHDHPKLSRSNSVTSQSTMASFATATEGERNDDLESVLYWDQRFNDELRNNDHYESDEETEDGRGTPRGPSRQDEPNNSHRLSTSSATSELTSSFVSSVQAASPHLSDTSVLDDTDTRMLEQLFESLGNVCTELQSVTSKGDDEKTIRVLRRRLDAARRALEGELDA